MSEPGQLPPAGQMKSICHGWFLTENDDGPLSLPDVKENECQTGFSNVRKDTFTFANKRLSQNRKASSPRRRQPKRALRSADPAPHRGIAIKIEAAFVRNARVSQ